MFLDRSRGTDRIVHPVEAPFVGNDLAVQQPADEADGLIQSFDALAESVAKIEAERLVLPFEPRRTDAQYRSAAGEVVEGRCQLGREPRVPEGVGAHHETQPGPTGQGGQSSQDAPAFEDGLIRRAEDRVEMVPRPDRFPAGSFGK